MTSHSFHGARLFDGGQFRDTPLHVADGHITDTPGTQRTDLPGGILAPGFVDLQVNGGGGLLFNHSPDVQTLGIMAQAHASLGATTILPTLITDTPAITRSAIEATVQAIAQGIPGIAGLHLEGPHLALAKAGAHDPALIRPMSADDLETLLDATRRLPVLKVTLAPETVTPDQIATLSRAGALVSLGHSNCTFAQAAAATRSGARCVTHLFNAMSQPTAREPGLAGAALSLGDLHTGLIADLIHVHPAMLTLALAAKQGPGQVFLVSDAMAVAGSTTQSFTLNGRTVTRAQGRLTLADGTLAGADLDLATALRNLAGLGLTPDQSLPMATRIPASLIGSARGSLLEGAAADMIWLDDTLHLQGVWRAGVRIA